MLMLMITVIPRNISVVFVTRKSFKKKRKKYKKKRNKK